MNQSQRKKQENLRLQRNDEQVEPLGLLYTGEDGLLSHWWFWLTFSPVIIDHRTELQTEAAMGRQQGIAGHVWSYLAIAQDEVGQDGEYRATRRALETPDGDPTQADSQVMRVARQAPAAATRRLVFQLKTDGQDKSHHTFEKRLAVAKQLEVSRFVPEIDSDGAVFACRFGRCAHVSPLWHQVSKAGETPWG